MARGQAIGKCDEDGDSWVPVGDILEDDDRARIVSRESEVPNDQKREVPRVAQALWQFGLLPRRL